MNFARKVVRNKIRNKYGNKAMKEEWRKYQEQKYGELLYEKMIRDAEHLRGLKKLKKISKALIKKVRTKRISKENRFLKFLLLR